MNKLKEQIDMELQELRADTAILENAKRTATTKLQSKGSNRAFGGRRGNRHFTRTAACLAAILVIGGITAAASGVFGQFTEFFNGDLEPYHDQILQSTRYGENDNFAVGIDGVVSDDKQCMFVLKLEALSHSGKQDLREMGKKHQNILREKMTLSACLADGTKQEFYGLSVFEYTDLQSSDFRSYVVTVSAKDIGIDKLDHLEKIQVEFEDITMEALMDHPMQSVILTAESSDGEVAANDQMRNVELSPIGFSFNGYGEDFEIRLIQKDGTLTGQDKSYSFGYSKAVDEEEAAVYGDFRYEILNMDEYLGLQINGINYVK